MAFELIRPEDFEVAQRVADRLRDGASVLIDFGGCERALAGRLTDFASGLVYALGGSLQHVGGDVILLTPSHMAVSGDEESGVRDARLLQPGLTTPMLARPTHDRHDPDAHRFAGVAGGCYRRKLKPGAGPGTLSHSARRRRSA